MTSALDALAGLMVMRAVVSVRLSGRLFHLYLLNELTFETLIFCMFMGDDHCSSEIEGQAHRSRPMQKCVCYTSIYCGVL